MTFCGVGADGVGDGTEDGVMGGVYAEGGGMEARREVGDGVDVYAQGAVSEFDGAVASSRVVRRCTPEASKKAAP